MSYLYATSSSGSHLAPGGGQEQSGCSLYLPCLRQAFQIQRLSLVTAVPRASFLSHTIKPSLNHIPGRNLISPTPSAVFPQKVENLTVLWRIWLDHRAPVLLYTVLNGGGLGSFCLHQTAEPGARRSRICPWMVAIADSGLGKSLDSL